MIKLFLGIFRRLKRFFRNIFLCVFLPGSDPDLTVRPCRPTARSTEPWAGRPLRSTDVHSLVHVWQTLGRPTGQSTGPESSALCIWAVGRAVDRFGPTVINMTVGGRPGGRPQACQAARSA